MKAIDRATKVIENAEIEKYINDYPLTFPEITDDIIQYMTVADNEPLLLNVFNNTHVFSLFPSHLAEQLAGEFNGLGNERKYTVHTVAGKTSVIAIWESGKYLQLLSIDHI